MKNQPRKDYAKMDITELAKREEEKKSKNKKQSKFLIDEHKVDVKLYNKLYKFDPDVELSDFTPQFEKVKNPIRQKNAPLSQEDKPSDNISNQTQILSQTQKSEIREQTESLCEKDILTQVLQSSKTGHVNKIQNAMYEDQNVREHMQLLQQGSDAIAFFAKYGSTTPIKFIYCVKQTGLEYNPYKLKIVHDESELDLVDKYFTVSPSGIVIIHHGRVSSLQANIKKKEPTEFISLSDWMRESTLFNILSNIDFFKQYLRNKIIKKWRDNSKKKIFLQIRERMRHEVLYCKPAYQETLYGVKETLQRTKQCELVNFSQFQQKQVDIEEFKALQKEVRMKTGKEFEQAIEDIVEQFQKLISKILHAKKQNSVVDEDFSLLNKQKPLNMIKKEKNERKLRKKLTEEDFKQLGQYAQIINYMIFEQHIENNQRAVNRIEEELYKERKNGLFTISPILEETAVNFGNREEDLHASIDSILDDNIKTLRELPQVIGNPSLIANMKEYYNLFPNSPTKPPNLKKAIIHTHEYIMKRKSIQYKIKSDFTDCRRKIELNYAQCRKIETERQRFKIDSWLQMQPKLEEVKAKLNQMKDFKKESNEKIKDYFFGILHVDSKFIKGKLGSFINDTFERITKYLYQMTAEKIGETLKSLEYLQAKLGGSFDNLNEFCDYIKNINEVKNLLDSVDTSRIVLDQMYKLIKQVNPQLLHIDDQSRLQQIQNQREQLATALPVAEEQIKQSREYFANKLQETIINVNDKAEELFKTLMAPELRTTATDSQEIKKRLQLAHDRLQKLNLRYQKAKEFRQLMETALVEPKYEYQLLYEIFERKKQSWELHDAFTKSHTKWFESSIKKLNIDEIKNELSSYEQRQRDIKFRLSEQIQKITDQFENLIAQPNALQTNTSTPLTDTDTNDELLRFLQQRIEIVKQMLPVLTNLCNKHLKDKHWAQILELVDPQGTVTGKAIINLQDLVTLGIKNFVEQLDDIAVRASGEAAIEISIESIKRDWQDMCFVVKPYRDNKDKFLIAQAEDVFEKLNDDLLKIQGMMGSRHCKGVKETLQVWEKRLAVVHETTEEWLLFQQQWIGLESIFAVEDIQKQLPAEFNRFNSIDKQWREIMLSVSKKPTILEQVSQNLLESFKEMNSQMSIIQRLLEDFLELKRRIFPRFFFLSNDELLEILSQSRNPETIQPFLRKCFDNIDKLTFVPDQLGKVLITEIASVEPEAAPEIVRLSSAVEVSGPIEQWLNQLDKLSKDTIYFKLSELIDRHKQCEDIIDLSIIFDFPAQTVLAVNVMRWTLFIEDLSLDGQIDALPSLIQQQIDNLVKLSQTHKAPHHQQIIKNLLIQCVHNRDTTNQLIQHQRSIRDYDYIKILRYYWEYPNEENQYNQADGEQQELFLRQTNSQLAYGYEYLGNGGRLVITPLTDKCFISLTTAIQMGCGGQIAGPAGTGKTETVKDLAKAVAVQCIVFNCSDGIDYRTMGRLFTGLAFCGAWSCFDEFNRLTVDVLSVVAQQIMIIQTALKENQRDFDFEGKLIQLNAHFGIFVTFNPLYAGRRELPDNLKALFRPVSMIVPDASLIAEVILFTEGFLNATILGKKIVSLFKLFSSQLSHQRHYDFGLRAIKETLAHAGHFRQLYSQSPEDATIIAALKQANFSKLHTADLSSFNDLISDIFPITSPLSLENDAVNQSYSSFLTMSQFNPNKALLDKLQQLEAACRIRTGIILIGPTSTGKSACLDMLLHHFSHNGKKAHFQKINPKSVTVNELFGYSDVYTQIFTPGILWKIIQSYAEDSDIETRQLFIFDGHIDPEWVENLNTALDDNKLFCFPDGKRINIHQGVNLIFETEDIQSASPATISRCGIIFFNKGTVTFKDIFSKFQKRLQTNLEQKIERQKALSQKLYEAIYKTDFMQQVQEIIDNFMSFLVEIDPLQNDQAISDLQNGFLIFEAMIEEFRHSFNKKILSFKVQQAQEKFIKEINIHDHLLSIFIFCLTNSLFYNLNEQQRLQINKSMRQGMAKRCGNCFANVQSLFEFFYNMEKLYPASWREAVREFQYSPSLPFKKIFVDTNESASLRLFLQLASQSGIEALISGQCGAGKSVIVDDYIAKLDDNFTSVTFAFTGRTSPLQLIQILEEKLQLRGKDMLPPNGKQMLFIIDDINLPKPQQYNSVPVAELVRQLIDQHGYYDRQKHTFRQLKHVSFVGLKVPPSSGRYALDQRLKSKFFKITHTSLSDKSIEQIYSSILNNQVIQQQERKLTGAACQTIVQSTIKVFKDLQATLFPTPTKCHYIFTMRDISSVFEGIFLSDFASLQGDEQLYLLWLHELNRVFSDRLMEDVDRQQLQNKIIKHMPSEYLQVDQIIRGVIYTKIGKENYQLVNGEEELKEIIQEGLETYYSYYHQEMKMIIFEEVMHHINRISRILSFERGSVIALGLSGCGKSTISEAAIFLGGVRKFTFEASQTQKIQSWREELKNIVKQSYQEGGIDGLRGGCLFLRDDAIQCEYIVEDVSRLLSSNDSGWLFTKEEAELIISEIQTSSKSKQMASMTKQQVWQHFSQTSQNNFHIAIAINSQGDFFRKTVRDFPSLVSRCQVDFFDQWPEQATISIIQQQLVLQNFNEGDEALKLVAKTIFRITDTVHQNSFDYYNDTKTKIFITPQSHLDNLSCFMNLYRQRKKEDPVKLALYKTGIAKIGEAQGNIATLQNKIIKLQPELERLHEINEKLLKELEISNKEASEKERLCDTEANEIHKMRTEADKLKEQLEQNLNEAMPALVAAQQAARNVDKNYIAIIKSYNTVAKDIEMVLLAVNVIFQKKETWEDVRRFLQDIDFLKKLKELDPMTVPYTQWKKLRQDYLNKTEFNPQQLSEHSAEAIGTLAHYCINMETFYLRKSEILPLEEKLHDAELRLNEIQKRYDIKFSELESLRSDLKSLVQKFNDSQQKSKELQDQKDTAKVQLERARILITGLSEEYKRWTEHALLLQQRQQTLIGDSLQVAGLLSLLGPFNSQFRKQAFEQWNALLNDNKVTNSLKIDLLKWIGDSALISNWLSKGLPNDSQSLENACIIMKGFKTPYLIDPQYQMSKWLKSIGRDFNLIIQDYASPGLAKIIESAVKFGNSILLENFTDDANNTLDAIIQRKFKQKGVQAFITLGNVEVPFSHDFKLFLSTKLKHAVYGSSNHSKVALVDCSITEQGLEEQLLSELIILSAPHLEKQRDLLERQIAEDKRSQQETRYQLLKLISDSQGNLLEDDSLVQMLDTSKKTFDLINQRMQESFKNNDEIDQTRNIFKPLALLGRQLFFVIHRFYLLNSAYAISLNYFIWLFRKRVSEFKGDQDRGNEWVTRSSKLIQQKLYLSFSRGFFEEHRPLFYFLLATQIQIQNNTLPYQQYQFFVTQKGPIRETDVEKPSWLNNTLWQKLSFISQNIPICNNLLSQIKENSDNFRLLLSSLKFSIQDLLCIVNPELLTPWQILLLIRVIRPDHLHIFLTQYIDNVLQTAYVKNQTLDIKALFNDSEQATPIVFLLQKGVDPLNSIISMTVSFNMQHRHKMLSLGQSNCEKTKEVIKSAKLNGDWVILQNYHLALGWISELEQIIQSDNAEESNQDFRLIITTTTSDDLSSPLLQNSLKLALQPPSNVKEALKQIYQNMNDQEYQCLPKADILQPLMFALCIFHTSLTLRNKYGQQAWTDNYDWMLSDLDISIKHLKIFVETFDEVPYEILYSVIGDINYGGRITNFNDQIILSAMLNYFINDSIFSPNSFFCQSYGSVNYKVPRTDQLIAIHEYIETLPANDPPELLGLHKNALLSLQTNTLDLFFDNLQKYEPIGQTVFQQSINDQIVSSQIQTFLETIPPLISSPFDETKNPLSIFRNQEIARFNILLTVIKNDLISLQDAIGGKISMSLEQDILYTDIIHQKVPLQWLKLSYPSASELSLWFENLLQRIKFMNLWIEKGTLKSYWISAFFFPQGLITSVLQQHARSQGLQLDQLTFQAIVQNEMFFNYDEVVNYPPDGINVHGLFLQNAHWNFEKQIIQEQINNILIEPMPIFWIKPIGISAKIQSSKLYKCPIYQIDDNASMQANLNKYSNFIDFFDLDFEDSSQEFWSMRGTRLLLQKNEK